MSQQLLEELRLPPFWNARGKPNASSSTCLGIVTGAAFGAFFFQPLRRAVASCRGKLCRIYFYTIGMDLVHSFEHCRLPVFSKKIETGGLFNLFMRRRSLKSFVMTIPDVVVKFAWSFWRPNMKTSVFSCPAAKWRNKVEHCSVELFLKLVIIEMPTFLMPTFFNERHECIARVRIYSLTTYPKGPTGDEDMHMSEADSASNVFPASRREMHGHIIVLGLSLAKPFFNFTKETTLHFSHNTANFWHLEMPFGSVTLSSLLRIMLFHRNIVLCYMDSTLLTIIWPLIIGEIGDIKGPSKAWIQDVLRT